MHYTQPICIMVNRNEKIQRTKRERLEKHKNVKSLDISLEFACNPIAAKRYIVGFVNKMCAKSKIYQSVIILLI